MYLRSNPNQDAMIKSFLNAPDIDDAADDADWNYGFLRPTPCSSDFIKSFKWFSQIIFSNHSSDFLKSFTPHHKKKSMHVCGSHKISPAHSEYDIHLMIVHQEIYIYIHMYSYGNIYIESAMYGNIGGYIEEKRIVDNKFGCWSFVCLICNLAGACFTAPVWGPIRMAISWMGGLAVLFFDEMMEKNKNYSYTLKDYDAIFLLKAL